MITPASIGASAGGVLTVVVLLVFAWVGLVLISEDLWDSYHSTDRIRLAGRDDQDLNFKAALDCGPLPPYTQERDEGAVR